MGVGALPCSNKKFQYWMVIHNEIRCCFACGIAERAFTIIRNRFVSLEFLIKKKKFWFIESFNELWTLQWRPSSLLII